jgi:hypothetical protein
VARAEDTRQFGKGGRRALAEDNVVLAIEAHGFAILRSREDSVVLHALVRLGDYRRDRIAATSRSELSVYARPPLLQQR